MSWPEGAKEHENVNLCIRNLVDLILKTPVISAFIHSELFDLRNTIFKITEKLKPSSSIFLAYRLMNKLEEI